jgi:starch synthase
MKIAFITSEAYPYAKTGGLADVSHALPLALAERGHDVRLIMPRYYAIDRDRFGLRLSYAPLGVPMGNGEKWAALFESDFLGAVKTIFIEHDRYFGRDGLYDDGDRAYDDNAERFIFFSHAAIRGLRYLNFKPDIIHCNDWQTGLIPVYLNTMYAGDPFFSAAASIMTVHNAGYQGVFPKEAFYMTGLGEELFTPEGIEFFNQINFLKGGILFADAASTVSIKYARELQTAEFGYDIAGVFRKISGRFFGITNGVDYEKWDPRTDALIPERYSPEKMSGKAKCKAVIQERMGLPREPKVPLLGTISRITHQKGMDVLAQALPLLLADEQAQFIILGQGEDWIKGMMEQVARMFPGRVGIYWGYDEGLSHLIEAGLDIFIMPSRYEPCGLNQMYSMRYGTIPVVRATGGLDDTVEEWDSVLHAGNGFKFGELTVETVYRKLRQVLKAYRSETLWKRIRSNAMSYTYSWYDAAGHYERLYAAIIDKRNAEKAKGTSAL